MPGYDGTGPRGAGMFTGRGEGYCALRVPEAGSGEPATGYAGIAGRPVQPASGPEQSLRIIDTAPLGRLGAGFARQGWRRRCGRRK